MDGLRQRNLLTSAESRIPVHSSMKCLFVVHRWRLHHCTACGTTYNNNTTPDNNDDDIYSRFYKQCQVWWKPLGCFASINEEISRYVWWQCLDALSYALGGFASISWKICLVNYLPSEIVILLSLTHEGM